MGVLGAEGRGGIAANTQGGRVELLEASVFPVMTDLVQDCESEGQAAGYRRLCSSAFFCSARA